MEVKKAVPKDDGTAVVYSSERSYKVFLGGLPLDATKQDILEVLVDIGKPVEITIMTDKCTNNPRGFGFARFETYDEAEKVCGKKYFEIKVRYFGLNKQQCACTVLLFCATFFGGGGCWGMPLPEYLQVLWDHI